MSKRNRKSTILATLPVDESVDADRIDIDPIDTNEDIQDEATDSVDSDIDPVADSIVDETMNQQAAYAASLAAIASADEAAALATDKAAYEAMNPVADETIDEVADPIVNETTDEVTDPIVDETIDEVTDSENVPYTDSELGNEPKPDPEIKEETTKVPEIDYGTLSQYDKSEFAYPTFERLVADLDFNVRDPEAYSDANLAALGESLRLFGLMEPFVVSEQPDGMLKVLKGHRRYVAMAKARAAFLKLVDAKTADKKDLPWKRVKCDVKKGMTLADETALMIDHGNRRGLNPAETYKSVLRLKALGWSETVIGNHLSLPRGKVTTHFRAASMPAPVREMYSKHLNKATDALPMTKDTIDKLYKAQSEDKKAGKITFGGGPSFVKEWTAVQANVIKTDRGQSAKSKIEDLLQSRNEHPLFNALLKHLLGQSEGLAKLDDVINNVLRAFNSTFPIEKKNPVVVTEGNVTNVID